MRRVKQICISVPADWIAVLDQRAEARGISRSSLVARVLYDAIFSRSANGRGEEVEQLDSRNDLFTGAWYVEYLDENGQEQLTTYMNCSDALKAYYELERPVRFGMLFSNGHMQALAVKEVPDDGEA